MIFLLLLIPPQYHTYLQIEKTIDSLYSIYPSIMDVSTLGYSTRDSVPILGVKISDNPEIREDEPSILYVGVHHAEELLGAEICLSMINDLVSAYGNDTEKTEWINENQIWIVPVLNPDGHNVVTSGQCLIWRKNKRDNNGNGVFDLGYDGVDLNRNYDYKWSESGSSNPGDEYYYGTSPFSENETQAMRDLCLSEHFLLAITYHSARTGMGEVIYYPWRIGAETCNDYPFIKVIAESIAYRIPKDDSTGTYVPLLTSGNLGGFFRNWVYAAVGTLPFLIEVSDTTIPPGEMVKPIVKKNIQGAYYFFKRLKGPGIVGWVKDSISGAPLLAKVSILEIDTSNIPERFTDTAYGRFQRFLSPGTYTLRIEADGYNTRELNINIGEEPETLNIHLIPSSFPVNSESLFISCIQIGRINIDVWEPAPKRQRIILYDIAGRKIYEKMEDLVQGLNHITLNTRIVPGVYILDIGKRIRVVYLK